MRRLSKGNKLFTVDVKRSFSFMINNVALSNLPMAIGASSTTWLINIFFIEYINQNKNLVNKTAEKVNIVGIDTEELIKHSKTKKRIGKSGQNYNSNKRAILS